MAPHKKSNISSQYIHRRRETASIACNPALSQNGRLDAAQKALDSCHVLVGIGLEGKGPILALAHIGAQFQIETQEKDHSFTQENFEAELADIEEEMKKTGK